MQNKGSKTYLYRVLGGVGVGLASAICPMYIAEVAPSNKRGSLVSWNQFAIIFGPLVVYFVNFMILGDHISPKMESLAEGINRIVNAEVLMMDGNWSVTTCWRLMFGSECLLAALFVWRMVPETKGKTLEDMTALWRARSGKKKE